MRSGTATAATATSAPGTDSTARARSSESPPATTPDWSDSSGPFQGNDWKQPKSVANNGTIGGNDVVAFYLALNYAAEHGYVCLSPYELYADDVTDNTYTSGSVPTHISSHRWVQSSACAANSWLT
ncbi:hypothetical protein ACIBU0_33350 [Streptomyces sp. NPDC049627]|uniref:hypothetical protein n=1 Tax=Streptomyces sp. NPDC049627 TaxID=3365595 RepID=UPI0037948EBE